MMSMNQANVVQRTAQLQTTGRTGLITNAAAGIESGAMAGEFRGTKMASILLEPKQNDECGLHHITKATQLKLSQKVVDHTYRLFGSQLSFAKDVPTHAITSPDSL